MTRMTSQCMVVLVLASIFVGCTSALSNPEGWVYDIGQWSSGSSVQQTEDGGFFVVGLQGPTEEDYTPRTFAAKLTASLQLEVLAAPEDVFPVAAGVIPNYQLGWYCRDSMVLAGVDMHHTGETDGKTRLHVKAFDVAGSLLWGNVYSPEIEIEPEAMTITHDEGYLIVADESEGPMPHTVLLKLSSTGTQVWQKSFGEGSYQRVRRAKLLEDGSVVLAGRTVSEATGAQYGFDFLLAKVDPSGDIVWRREYNQAGRQEALGLGLMPDGGFVLAGTDQGKPYVMRTDPEGEVLWARHDVMGFEPTQNDYSLYDVAVGPGDSITIVGYGQTLGTAGPLPTVSKTRFVMQLDGDGNNRWTTDIRPTYGYGITYTTEGTYMVCGTAFTRQGQVLNLIELDQTGRILD